MNRRDLLKWAPAAVAVAAAPISPKETNIREGLPDVQWRKFGRDSVFVNEVGDNVSWVRLNDRARW